MNRTVDKKEIITTLLEIDLRSNAQKLGFIKNYSFEMDQDFIMKSVKVLDELSEKNDEESKRSLIAISALLWTYGGGQWSGLKNYLMLFLSRAGFGPSSIMLDKDYKNNNNSFSSTESLINQFAITLNQLKYEVFVKESSYLLTGFQKEVWDEIDLNKLVGISAPTSAGKSFVILLKAIDLLSRKSGNIIYVVPTLTLVSQVAHDFREALREFALDEYSIETTFNIEKKGGKRIYVLTQEKAIAAFSQSAVPFSEIRLLVIDEIQNVERVADSNDQRAKILYDLMIELKNTATVGHIIISGPRIEGIDGLGKEIFGIDGKKSEVKSSPVMSLTYSISKKKTDYYFNLYSDSISNKLNLKIEDIEKIKGYGGKQYNAEYLNFLSDFVECIGKDQSNIIFSPTTRVCRQIAEKLGDNSKVENDDYLNELSKYLAESVHPEFALSKTVKKGVGYHHGRLPQHVRIVLEDGIRKRHIKNIVCTTTLLQGVNLPVQNIIVRSPNLFVRTQSGKENARLTNYEMANLRGRAGRLLKDFIGRTYVVDEASFSLNVDSAQGNLFENETKSLKVGYKERFDEFEKKIKDDLESNVGQEINNEEYSYLTTYIRQSAFRYGTKAAFHLKNVGIVLPEEYLLDIQKEIEKSKISKELCALNRYWDPFDLAKIEKESLKVQIPTSITEQGLSYKLKAIAEFFREKLPVYYNRYFKIVEVPGRNILLSKCILAERWLKEKSMRDILSDSFYSDTEKVEDAISALQNNISFGLPMLIKPLYDIRARGSMFPRFIEMGSYKPITRRLIELNIPRETAIFLESNFSFNDDSETNSLVRQLREITPKLSIWHRVQLESI
jgi:hypothetical protein